MRLLRASTALALLWMAVWLQRRANIILASIRAQRLVFATRRRPTGPLVTLNQISARAQS